MRGLDVIATEAVRLAVVASAALADGLMFSIDARNHCAFAHRPTRKTD